MKTAVKIIQNQIVDTAVLIYTVFWLVFSAFCAYAFIGYDFQTINIVPYLSSAALLGLFLFRKKLSLGSKIHGFALVCILLGAMGMVSSFHNAGFYMLIPCIAIVAMVLGAVQAIRYALAILILLLLISFGQYHELIGYFRLVPKEGLVWFSWVGRVVGIFVAFVVIVFRTYRPNG